MSTTHDGSEMFFDIPCGRLGAKVWGPTDGAPVLALHGWLDNAASFDPVARFLPSNVRLIAVDMMGHGLSDHRPPGAVYHFIDYITDVSDLLDFLGWERVCLMGHSMGAAIAGLVAGTVPERVRSLIFLDGMGPLTGLPEDTPAQVGALIKQMTRMGKRQAYVYPHRESLAMRLREVVTGLSAEAADLLVARGTVLTDKGVTWRSDARLRLPSPLKLTEAHVEAFWRRIVCPTLFVQATDGYVFDGDVLTARCGWIQNLNIERVVGSHHAHMNHPADIMRVVEPYLTLGC